MDLPSISTNGFPGKRDDSYLAGIIPIVLISKVSHYFVYLKKIINISVTRKMNSPTRTHRSVTTFTVIKKNMVKLF